MSIHVTFWKGIIMAEDAEKNNKQLSEINLIISKLLVGLLFAVLLSGFSIILTGYYYFEDLNKKQIEHIQEILKTCK